MRTFWSKVFRQSAEPVMGKKLAHRRAPRLAVEQLETRLVPIIGASSIPAAVARGSGFDGVVRLDAASGMGTGTLLFTGRHILTAASYLTDEDRNIDAPETWVTFEMPGRDLSIPVPQANYRIHPNWNGDVGDGYDLAILELPWVAPLGAERYGVYRGGDEVGRWYYAVGYGQSGRANQSPRLTEAAGTKRMGTNYFDDTAGPYDTKLKADFDSDAREWAPAQIEVMAAPGDHGSPSFLWGPTGLEVAAVTSYVQDNNLFGGQPEFEFGELWYSTRVSRYDRAWIDATVAVTRPYELVLFMDYGQSSGNDGAADWIQVENLNGTLRLFLNGQLVHAELASNIASLNIQGSDDDDDIVIYRDGVSMPITINGRGGNNDLTIYGTPSSDSVTLENKGLEASGWVTFNSVAIGYNDIQTLYLRTNGGNDWITVRGTPSNTAVTVDGWDGDDFITVGNRLGNLSFLSNVMVHGGNGHDRLTVSDRLHSSGDNYRISNNHVRWDRLPDRRINYGTVENLVLATGDGADTITILSSQAGTTTTVRAGGGADTINGDAAHNILLGEGGNDNLYGNFGKDLLIGGLGADTVRGGVGEDILIDGTTGHDTSDAALYSLLAEWSRTDLGLDQRVTNLRNGGGLNGTIRLTGTTVRSDADVDVLTGGDHRDWFWFGGMPPLFPPPGGAPARDTLTDLAGLLIAFGHANAVDDANPILSPPRQLP